MAIPKKIHWCWLSGDPLPTLIQDCVDSWHRVMPDYEFVLWDMNRFDIHSVKFVEDACAARKWAFAADYIRLYALFTEGGIYLDVDVMVYRRFDKFLHHAAFSSSCTTLDAGAEYWIEAEMMGAEKGNKWIGMCLEHYRNEKVFRMKDGGTDVETIPKVMTRYAHEHLGYRYDLSSGDIQRLKDGIVIYPDNVFAYLWKGVAMDTYAAHLSMSSWAGGGVQRKSRAQQFYDRTCAKSRFLAMLHSKRKHFFHKMRKMFRLFS